MRIPFVDLRLQYKEIEKDMNLAFKNLVKRGDFILGEDVGKFEKRFAAYCGSGFGLGVNSGTDALFLALRSLDIGEGDEVIVPAFTYIATAFAVTYTGAKPVFVDINPETYNIDTDKIAKAITKKTKAIIPVHLYGQAADMHPIMKIAAKFGLKVIEDAAQAHGVKYKYPDGKIAKVGSIGDVGCFSFYPTKNLGAFGDGGMITTNDENVYKKLFKLRDYGRKSRYEHVCLGYNSRLDGMQSIILLEKLKHIDEWNKMRRKCAGIYNANFKGIREIVTPKEMPYSSHIYHVYAIRVKNRDEIVPVLQKKGIGVLVHYPVPLHLQEVYKNLGYKRGDFAVAEKVSAEVMSLPMYPHLKETQIKIVCDAIKQQLTPDNFR